MPREPVIDLPHSDDAERALLGAILISNNLLSQVHDHLAVGDFYREASRLVYTAMRRLEASGTAIDLVSLKEELGRTGELERAGGAVRLALLLDGVPRAANILHYAMIVKQKARRRAIMAAAEKLQTAASNGVDEEGLQALLADMQVAAVDSVPQYTPSTLAGVSNPDSGTVPYIVHGFLPAGDATVIGATWKSGKTLLAYRLVLDLITGKPAFGALAIPQPVPVVVFQLEMPPWEDDRRLRRLAIGCGIPPEHIPRYAAEGHLTLFNRPPINLVTPEGAARFCRTVKSTGARVVIIDSLIAAFAGADLNDNSTVRGLFSRAFGPLTSEGITVMAPHHHRKGQAGGKKAQDDRSALLGAQAFGAAAGRVYKLDRLGKEDDPETDKSSFRLKLSLTGSWTPENAEDLILSVQDTDNGGTTVTLLTEAEQIRRGGMNARQRAGIAIARHVRGRPGIERKACLKRVLDDEGVSDSTVKGGLWYAQNRGWVKVDHPVGRLNNQAVLLPGETSEGGP